jgi:ActR/RegA family two-component response regulator
MEREPLLLVAAPGEATRNLAKTLTAQGHAVTVAHSVAEAYSLCDRFSRGLFAFDLDDGSGIVLAAALLAAGRLEHVAFIHPADHAALRGIASGSRPLSELADVKVA